MKKSILFHKVNEPMILLTIWFYPARNAMMKKTTDYRFNDSEEKNENLFKIGLIKFIKLGIKKSINF